MCCAKARTKASPDRCRVSQDLFAGRFHPIRYATIVDRDDTVVTDRHTIHVRCQVFQYRLAVTDRFDIHHPVELQHTRRQLRVQARLLQLFDEEFFVKHLRGFRMEQLVLGDLQPS